MNDGQMEFEMEFARVIRMYYCRMQAQLAEVGLFRGQPPILGLLHKHDGMSQKEMARALNLSPATMTVTLKRMEKAGLIVREMDEHDQRILRVHLSAQGKQMCQKGEKQVNQVTSELLEGFTEEEQERLKEYLRRIAHNMERVVREADMEMTDGEARG